MATKEELLLELSTNQNLINAQLQRMNFLEELRAQPRNLLHTMMALDAYHPEILQQLRAIPSEYISTLTGNLDFLQLVFMPYQLQILFGQRQQLENQLLAMEHAQQPSNQEHPPAAEDAAAEAPGGEEAAAAASATSKAREDKDEEDPESDVDTTAGHSRQDGNGGGDDGSDSSSGNASQGSQGSNASPDCNAGGNGNAPPSSQGDLHGGQGQGDRGTEDAEAAIHLGGDSPNAADSGLDAPCSAADALEVPASIVGACCEAPDQVA